MKALLYTLFRPLLEFLAKVWGFIPNLLSAITIVIVGYIVAKILKGVAEGMLGLINFDAMAEKMGITKVLEKGGIARSPTAILVEIFYALVLITFAMVGIDALKLEATSQLVNLFFLYLPRIFAAIVILILGCLFANFLSKVVLAASMGADLPYPKAFSEAVRLIILVLVVAMTLEQLSIAGTVVLSAFSIAFGGIVLALALAFGLGGREVAKEVLEKGLNSRRREKGRSRRSATTKRS